MNFTRRHWLSTCTALAGLPEVASALQHANAVKQSSTAKFQTLDPATAGEIEAIAAQIIPSVHRWPGGPRSRRHLLHRPCSLDICRGDVDTYRTGMLELQQKRQELFPELDSHCCTYRRTVSCPLSAPLRPSAFFELLRTHTVLGFLGEPELRRQSRRSRMAADRVR